MSSVGRIKLMEGISVQWVYNYIASCLNLSTTATSPNGNRQFFQRLTKKSRIFTKFELYQGALMIYVAIAF